jgi:hypothetical protein
MRAQIVSLVLLALLAGAQANGEWLMPLITLTF